MGVLDLGQPAQKQLRPPPRDQQSEHRCRPDYKDALGQQLPDEGGTARANRQPHAEFTPARGATGEKQVRHVETRDQQEQAGACQRGRQHALEPLGRRKTSPAPIDETNERRSFARSSRARPQMLKRQLRGRFRLCAIHARLETRDRAPEAARALIEQLQRGHQPRLHPWLQHHGNANVRRLPDVQPGETWRRYSDDPELVSVQENALSNDPSIGVQAAGEEVVPDDRRRLPGRAVRIRGEVGSQEQRHPEHREEVAGDNFADHAVRAIADASREPVRTVERDTGKDLPLFAKSPKNGSRKTDLFACSRLEGLQLDERIGVGHLERPPRDRVEHREDRRIRADAERHRQHRDGGCRRTAAQGADAKAEIPHHLLAASPPGGFVHGCNSCEPTGAHIDSDAA